MRYDYVIYDLDGTLLNTLDDLAGSVNHAMAAFGYPTHSVQAVCAMVGNGMDNLIRLAMPEDLRNDADLRRQVLSVFQQHYALHSDDLTCAYDGIEEMLDVLAKAGVKQAIVSNKGDPFVKELNQKYFANWVELAVGEHAGVRRKPWPDSVLQIMGQWQCSPARTLYVGDSDVDIQTARNAGVDCASVCWGFRTEEQLREAGAACLIRTPKALAALVMGE